MYVYGVGLQGKDVDVDEDFSIHVPYGWCYDINEQASGDEYVFMMFHPKIRPYKYKDDRFDLDDDADCENIINFQHQGKITVEETATEMPFDISELLKNMSDNAEDYSYSISFGDDTNEKAFRNIYKVIKDEPFLKNGYFTSGLFGKTVYNVMLVTSHYVYLAPTINFTGDNYADNEKILNEILSSIKPLNVKKYKKVATQKVVEHKENTFSQPTYLQETRVKVGTLNVMIPDGFEYVTENHIPQNDSRAEKLLDEYSMVLAPADYKEGLTKFKDASLGINISKSEDNELSADAWENISAIKELYNAKYNARKLKYVKEGKKYLIGYGRGNECQEAGEPYWVIYFVLIICGDLAYMLNLYFNSKKVSDLQYSKAVENFCSHIQINEASLEDAEVNKRRKEIGSMLTENGRLDGILASQLYTKDVIFNNDDEVSYDGKHTKITGFQLNAAAMDDYPLIVKYSSSVVKELNRLIVFVEKNEKLMLPKSKIHPEILKATRGNPITGATVFELCAWHMLLIVESDKNKYTVAIDKNLIKGIPDAFSFVGEFIKTLRAYNEIDDDFEVEYASTLNFDGPCENISTPVSGAVVENAKTIYVKRENKGQRLQNKKSDRVRELESSKLALESVIEMGKEKKEALLSDFNKAEMTYKQGLENAESNIAEIEGRIKNLKDDFNKESIAFATEENKRKKLDDMREDLKNAYAEYEVKQDIAEAFAKMPTKGLSKKKKLAMNEEKQTDVKTAKLKLEKIQKWYDSLETELETIAEKKKESEKEFNSKLSELQAQLDEENAKKEKLQLVYDDAKKHYDDEMEYYKSKEEELKKINRKLASM